jgi:succinoglycan biosynthesis transport protein ExoP
MPGKLDDPVFRGWEDYWAIAVRRRWWILLPMFVSWVTIWGVSWFLPSRYESEALVLVEQQQVPDQYVMPNVTINLQDRLQSITQETLSRTRLLSMIDRIHLYPTHAGLSGLLRSSDPVEQMRSDIRIELVRSPGRPSEFTAFKMNYSAGSPELAQQVNNELTSLFVNENVKAQQQLSEDTTSFLENQLADARAKMEEQEAGVAVFKKQHLGELPSQLESNVQIMAGLQNQLQNTHQAMDAAKQQQLYLESLLQQYQSTHPILADGEPTSTPETTLVKELMDMRLRLRGLQSRYTDDHPDIVALKDSIAKTESLKKQVDTEAAATPENDKAAGVPDPALSVELAGDSSNSMVEVQSQLKAKQLEIQNDRQQANNLESQISTYRGRLNIAPETEQQLTEISRGYEESKANYDSLLEKKMQSQLATSLEQREKGEQFRIVDPPSLPSKPSAPNHFRLSLGGLALGIFLGLGFATFLEVTDVRVRHEKDLEGLVPARVLVGIPRLNTPKEDLLRSKGRWLELGMAMLMASLISIGNLYSFYRN